MIFHFEDVPLMIDGYPVGSFRGTFEIDEYGNIETITLPEETWPGAIAKRKDPTPKSVDLWTGKGTTFSLERFLFDALKAELAFRFRYEIENATTDWDEVFEDRDADRRYAMQMVGLKVA